MIRHRHKIGTGEAPGGSLNTMIDVVFLLLIFFILQPFRMVDRQFPLPLPKAGQSDKNTVPKELPPPSITVRLIEDRGRTTALVMDRKVPLDTCGVAVRRCARNDGSVPVIVHPDRDVPFAHVMEVLDTCALAQMQRVSITGQRATDTAP